MLMAFRRMQAWIARTPFVRSLMALPQILVFFVMLMGSGVARADHICTNSPNETFVGYSQGGNGVAPMPICRWVESQADSSSPQRVVERWEVFDDRFGAIAIAPNGRYGVSSGADSSGAAEELALAQCRQRGGVGCESMGAHRNSCSTYAWGAGVAFTSGGDTSDSSERETLRKCQERAGVPCDVIETVCSKPVSRWVYERPDNWVPAEQ